LKTIREREVRGMLVTIYFRIFYFHVFYPETLKYTKEIKGIALSKCFCKVLARIQYMELKSGNNRKLQKM
jgi:hypothetical protein